MVYQGLFFQNAPGLDRVPVLGGVARRAGRVERLTAAHSEAVAASPFLRPPHHDDRRRWSRYVALGDSFTEGMNDVADDGSLVGWADRLASRLAGEQAPGDFGYANLAVRGNRVPHVGARQLPRALALAPDFATVAIGVNDMMRPSFHLERSLEVVDRVVGSLRSQGSDVLMVSFGDPRPRSRTLGLLAARIAEYGDGLRMIADTRGCYLADFWGAESFDDEQCWSSDRLHLGPIGHDIAARAALEALGRGGGEWRDPLPPAGEPTPLGRRLDDLRWVARDLAPWAGRRVLRVTQAQQCRRPELAPLAADEGTEVA
jgi:lysophospholipase L1-like esterase